MGDEVVRVGIVGLSAAGGFGAGGHVPALRALPEYEVRGLVASSPERSARAAEEHGVPLTFDDAAELAASDQIDLVVISVKVPEHDRLVRAALEGGKPVLCEWPLGNGLAEAEELARLAADRGIPTAVGLQARSAPALRFLRDLIAEGYVGEVLSSTIVGSGFSWGAEVPTAATRYSIDIRNGGTLLTIPMGHTLDAACFLFGELGDVRATTAIRRSEVHDAEADTMVPMTAPDQVAVTGVFANGAVLAAHYRGGMSRATNLRWEINGTEGDIVITGPTGHVQLADLQLLGARGGDTALTPLEVPERYNLVPALAGSSARVVNVANAYAQLLADRRDGTSVVPDFAHAVVRHRLLDQIERAGRR
jgi:predicted dehydrogenase